MKKERNYKMLFNRNVYFPNQTDEVCRRLQKLLVSGVVTFTNEFMKDADLKRDTTTALYNLASKPVECFEVELEFTSNPNRSDNHWYVSKYCCRTSYNKDKDIVVVIRPQYNSAVELIQHKIIHSYLVNKKDNHKTLNKSRYCTEEEFKSLCGRLEQIYG